MARVDALLADYASYHRTRGNFICHLFGITLIIYGIISFLQPLRLGEIGPLRPATGAELIIALVTAFYVTLDARLALGMLVATALLDLAAHSVGDWGWGLAAFVVGWIFQGVGHAVYEKNSPAFFKNLLHLLVGPIFLINELLRVRPVAEKKAT